MAEPPASLRSQMATVDIYTRPMSFEARGSKFILDVLLYHESPLRVSSLLLLVYITSILSHLSLVDSSIPHQAEQELPVYCAWLLLQSNTSRWASTCHPRASISGISISSLLTASGPPGNLDIQSWIWMNLLGPTRVRANQILRSILGDVSLDS